MGGLLQYGTHQCELCNRIYPARDCVLLLPRLCQPVRWEVVDAYRCGVRVLCIHCVGQLRSIPDVAATSQDEATATVGADTTT